MRDVETREIGFAIADMLRNMEQTAIGQAALFASSKGHHLRINHDLRVPWMPPIRLTLDLVGYDIHRTSPSIVDTLHAKLAAAQRRADELEADRMATDSRQRQQSRERRALLRMASKP